MAAITLDIAGNTRQLDRDIQKTVNRVYSINLKTKGDQPLGRITGKVNEFNKSLDASNARVIAFGASAGIIFGIERAFGALVQATIEVQKSLQDINVILNASQKQLQAFGSELFSIARNTGQSFQEVAKAATEFSRQGLGIEETLKRTSEALILSRLSGLDAAKSVESLTAAVNSFASQAVTATEVVNKFATVDAAFAVSSADLADAIARVGSSAAQSGVSLDELIAIVTSAQQTTARGGAVIGNSFKTIFTRLQREKVVDLLESLGISGTDASGQVKSTIQLLTELGKVYDTLGTQQQAYVAEQVGGVFQINILKAALADLGKEYSIYNNALNVSAGATDQAIRRNEELNKTYAAQINALTENARQLAAAGGERLLGPSIDRLVGGTNTLLEGFSESDGKGVGEVLGKGILDGLGQFIAGPGLALIGGVLLKLFRDLAKFATGSVQQLLGLNTAATQQRDLQQSINQILAKNPQLLELALKGEQGLNAAANSLLVNLQKQTVELQKQATVATQISKAFISQAGVRVAGGVPVVPTPKPGRTGKAAGYIPNFAEEFQAKELGATSSVKAVRGVGKIGGKSFEANNQEFQLKNFADTGETAVIPKYGNGIKEAAKMIARGESGSVLDKNDRNKAKGFVPNFALDTIANLKAKASRSGGLLGNLYDIGENNFFDKYQKPTIKRVPLQKNVSQYTKVADAFIRDVRKRASSDPNSVGSIFNNLRYKGTPISQFTDKIKPDTLLDPKKDLKNNINIKGALGEIDSQKRFGSGSRTAEKQGDLFGADFLVKKQGSSYLVESKVTQRKVPDNILIAKALQYEGQITGGKYKKNDINDEIKLKNIILSYAPFKNAASGFIPNFAQGKNAIDLGDTRTSPALKGKVLSLIHPGISQGYSMTPATASYLGQQYKGLIPVAGINQQVIKGQLPDLDKNLGDLLVREANQFGQVIGGGNFLKSAQDLPNFGAAKGAVGVAFEGGLLTLLRQNLQKTAQNAGIDFRQNRITPKLRNLFHGAPGMYDAKYSPELVNDVMGKLLQEAKVGEVKKVKSGPGYKDYDEQRKSALNYIRSLPPSEQPRRGNALEAAIRKRIAEQARLKGMAAGFIPNFAAPLVRAVDDKELKIMLSKFGKGWAFQGRSSEQSALEYFGGSGTYMWDALSRPGEQMSDRQAYKQNIGRAKNWSSARKQSSWLVRYNRSKLKDSELLPDMETGGASVYGLPLSKDQIVWPIKQSGGPGRIFEKDIPAFLSGQVNDAIKRESEAGIPKNKIYLAQENALKSANPMGLGVFNKLQEPTKQSRKDAMRSKGFARGYIPNFAIEDTDTQTASAGTAISAVVAQLGFLAFSLQGAGEQYKQSLSELTKSNVAQAKVNTKKVKEQISQKVPQPDFSKETKIKEKEFGKLRRSRSPEEQAKRDVAAAQLRESRAAEKKAAKGSGLQKLNAGGRAGGFGLALAAPILAQTLSQGISTDTKEGRLKSAGVGALGNVGAATATGAIFGPVGAAVGFAAGALLEIPGFVEQATTNFPELQAAAAKSSEELTKFSEAGARLQTSYENLQTALSDPNSSQNAISKASQDYAKALSELSIEDQKRIESAAKTGKLEDEYAKILAEKTAALKSAETAADAGKLAGESNKSQFSGTAARTALGITSFGLSELTGAGKIVQSLVAEGGTAAGTKGDKAIQEQFQSALFQGKIGKDALKVFQKAGGNDFVKELTSIQPGDTKALEDLLNKVIPEQEGKANYIASVIDIADNNATAFSDVIGSIGNSFLKTRNAAEQNVKSSNAAADAAKRESKAKDIATKATEQIIDSLQRNIRMAQMAADTNRALAKANSEFQRDTAFADAFSRPSETIGAIVGEGAPLADTFRLREDVAKIGFDAISNIEAIKYGFVDEINESIKTAFDDAVGETTKKATGEGTAKDIKQGNERILKPLATQQVNAFKDVQNVLNKALTGTGNINTESILSDISRSLQEANINGTTIEKITTQVRDSATKGNLEIKQLRDQSVKEFKTLAKDQTQKILIAKIGQAQKFGGGIEQFLTKQEPGQSTFDQLIKSTGGFEDFYGKKGKDGRFNYMPGTNEFRYQYKAADRARQEKAPEFGRAAIDLIDNLQAFTGYTPNPEGKAMKAGEAGLTEFYNRQVKQLQDVAKSSKTPQIVKDEINDALKEVNALGGTKTIAKLQLAQRTGSFNEKQYEEITKRFKDPTLEKFRQQAAGIQDSGLREQVMAEIDSLAQNTLISKDPTVNAINQSNQYLQGILEAVDGETQEEKLANKIALGRTEKYTEPSITDMSKTAPLIGPPPSADYKKYQELNMARPEGFKSQDDMLLNFLQRLNFKETGKIMSPEELGFKNNEKLPTEEKSFTQQEASLNANTNAIFTLNEEIRNLTSAITEKQNTDSNNQTANAERIGGGAQVTTTANTPVSVTVNAKGGGDVANIVGSEIEKSIPEIVNKVRLAMGEKIPPTIPKNKDYYSAYKFKP